MSAARHRHRAGGIRFACPLALALLAPLPAAADAPSEADYARVNAALVEGHTLPRYARLAAASGDFAVATEALCDSGSAAPAHAGFHAAMDAWMAVEHLRFGPVELLMRGHRFHFWPEARGRVAGAVRALVEAGDASALTPSRLAQADLAVQGLAAAEILLYGGERLGFHAADRPLACGLLAAIAANLRTMAAGIVAGWRQGDRPFAATAMQPGPQNAHFRDHREATLAFLASLHDGLQRLADVKLKPVLGRDIASARPPLAESRPSGRSLHNVVENLAALRSLYRGEGGPGLGALAAAADPALDGLLARAFETTLATARGIARPLEEAAADPALRPQAEKLLLQVRALRQLVRERLAPALALTLGFNAFDGD